MIFWLRDLGRRGKIPANDPPSFYRCVLSKLAISTISAAMKGLLSSFLAFAAFGCRSDEIPPSGFEPRGALKILHGAPAIAMRKTNGCPLMSRVSVGVGYLDQTTSINNLRALFGGFGSTHSRLSESSQNRESGSMSPKAVISCAASTLCRRIDPTPKFWTRIGGLPPVEQEVSDIPMPRGVTHGR